MLCSFFRTAWIACRPAADGQLRSQQIANRLLAQVEPAILAGAQDCRQRRLDLPLALRADLFHLNLSLNLNPRAS